MEIKTFRAKTMQLALNRVRQELGPEATVLHTRELNGSLLGRFLRGREYEIAASTEVNVPARLPQAESYGSALSTSVATIFDVDYRSKYREDFQQQQLQQQEQPFDEFHAIADQLPQRSSRATPQDSQESLFHFYADLIEADIEEQIAQELMERLRRDGTQAFSDPELLETKLVQMLQDELSVTGPIAASPGQGYIVALVGPTGVGKTTTIAKLAANYRLRENKRVGLITVDTYRIAAVEQLRTYADIIDLPMEVVSTPREMREAVARMRHLDLILMDTAGRSPRDEVRIQELKSLLAEAEPDEVHLVLSAVGGTRSLMSTAERFATVGTTALLVTKLDEATSLGNLLSVTRSSRLPISYVTDGQNVPDDIQVAEASVLAPMISGFANQTTQKL